MKKALVTTTLFVCVLLLCISAAQAQYDDGRSKLNLKLGVFRPSGSDDRMNTNNLWYTECLAYDCNIDEQGKPGGQLALTLMEPRGPSNASILSVTISKLWWKNSLGKNSLYFGVGIGAAKLKFLGDKTIKTEGELFVGHTLGEAYYLELRYTMLPSWRAYGFIDTNFSGFGLTLGTRKLF